MKKKIALLFIMLLAACYTSFADVVPYSDSIILKIKSKHFLVIHYHNWRQSTSQSRYEMISTKQDPFTPANNYAYIECIELKTGKIVFKKPTVALTTLIISKDEKYIAGISNIMLDNPFQMVVYSISGELIKKRHISSEEAKLTKSQMDEFRKNFSSQYLYLDSIGRIFFDNRYYYCDFISMDMPNKLGNAWKYLYEYISFNHLSKNFSQSATNWVFWYNETNPNITFKYRSKKLASIELLDPKLSKIDIKMDESLLSDR